MVSSAFNSMVDKQRLWTLLTVGALVAIDDDSGICNGFGDFLGIASVRRRRRRNQDQGKGGGRRGQESREEPGRTGGTINRSGGRLLC